MCVCVSTEAVLGVAWGSELLHQQFHISSSRPAKDQTAHTPQRLSPCGSQPPRQVYLVLEEVGLGEDYTQDLGLQTCTNE